MSLVGSSTQLWLMDEQSSVNCYRHLPGQLVISNCNQSTPGPHRLRAPSYVTDMLHKKPLHTRNTRSSSYTMPLLNRPAHSKATLGDRSFSFASSSVWNSIPNYVRCAPSLSSFKSRLKTYLFRSVYID